MYGFYYYRICSQSANEMCVCVCMRACVCGRHCLYFFFLSPFCVSGSHVHAYIRIHTHTHMPHATAATPPKRIPSRLTYRSEHPQDTFTHIGSADAPTSTVQSDISTQGVQDKIPYAYLRHHYYDILVYPLDWIDISQTGNLSTVSTVDDDILFSYLCICVSACVCVYVYVYVCMYMCVCVTITSPLTPQHSRTRC